MGRPTETLTLKNGVKLIFYCPKCKETFKTLRHFTEGWSPDWPESQKCKPKEFWYCPTCDRQFKTKGQAVRHIC